MTGVWDPSKYLAFSDHRDRPAHELLARVPAEAPRRVVDLGCGAGNLTALLTARWPDAQVEASDSSPEMVAAARERGVPAEVAGVEDWHPHPDTGVVLCNAVLQWVPDHVRLLRERLAELPSGAWFAMQVPGNFEAPSHARIREVAVDPRWRHSLDDALARTTVLPATGYADVLTDLGLAADAWETTYVHALRGPDPVLEWVTGTALRPVRAVLGDRDWELFRGELAERLRVDYPRRSDGITWFPFRRVFAVAHQL